MMEGTRGTKEMNQPKWPKEMKQPCLMARLRCKTWPESPRAGVRPDRQDRDRARRDEAGQHRKDNRQKAFFCSEEQCLFLLSCL